MQNSANTKPLNLELLRLQKISNNSCVNETGPNSSQKFVSSDNPSQNNWRKLKKYSKIGQASKM